MTNYCVCTDRMKQKGHSFLYRTNLLFYLFRKKGKRKDTERTAVKQAVHHRIEDGRLVTMYGTYTYITGGI